MHWIRFNEWCARQSTRGRIQQAAGLHATWSHTTLIVHNLTTLATPITDTADLRARGEAAVADASPYGLPWMLGIPEPWMTVSFEEANGALHEAGLHFMMDLNAMECAGPLTKPVRSLPQDVSGVIGSGDPYGRSNPFDFAAGSGGASVLLNISISAGDEIELRLVALDIGDYAGINLTIDTTSVPGPSSLGLLALGVLGILLSRKRMCNPTRKEVRSSQHPPESRLRVSGKSCAKVRLQHGVCGSRVGGSNMN